MKHTSLAILGLCILFLLSNCEGDQGAVGPAGPQGPQGTQGVEGPQGPIGIDGNANVRQYTFGPANFSASPYKVFSISTTADTVDRSAWYTYLYYEPIERWYFIPGLGYGGSTNHRVSIDYSNDKANLYIDRDGPGENYSKVRVVRIYANSVVEGGREGQAPEVDYSDYVAVRNYYGLDE